MEWTQIRYIACYKYSDIDKKLSQYYKALCFANCLTIFELIIGGFSKLD